MDPPRDQKKEPTTTIKVTVLDSGVEEACPLSNDKKVVETNRSGQYKTKRVVMTLPMALRDERPSAMIRSSIPNGSMIAQFGSTAVTPNAESMSH